jgi:hypothetical protein
MSDTPETDDQPIIYAINDNGYQVPCVDLEFARKLERERDEAIHGSCVNYNFTQDARRERDEARAELADWQDSAKNVRKEYDDEQHCSCVPILRKLLKDAERERDAARQLAIAFHRDQVELLLKLKANLEATQ